MLSTTAGMGDSCCSQHSMGAVANSIRQALPGTFVHSVATGQGESGDVLSSYFGSVNAQVWFLAAARSCACN